MLVGLDLFPELGVVVRVLAKMNKVFVPDVGGKKLVISVCLEGGHPIGCRAR